MPRQVGRSPYRVVVFWIDWYAYHIARFRGLESAPALAGQCKGIELVGGVGVHTGLKFREERSETLDVETLLPGVSWAETSHWALASKVWRRLTALDPEVVLVPGYYTLPALAAAVWTRMHRRTSVLMTESTKGDHERSGWKERCKGFGMRLLFDWAVCGGKAHVEYLDSLGFPPDRIVGSYNVVDNDFFNAGTKSLRATSSPSASGLPDSPYFLYVGRLAEEKNVGTLLAAWLLYREQGGSWPLVLVGDGPTATALKAEAAQSPYAADVLFPGMKSSFGLLPYYAFAGSFVLPSTREPWGLVANEAMASSLPVLLSDRCGCGPDLVVPAHNGWLFDPSDVGTLSALLAHIGSLPVERRTEMGTASATVISRFSPQHFGASIATITTKVSASQSVVHAISGGTK